MIQTDPSIWSDRDPQTPKGAIAKSVCGGLRLAKKLYRMLPLSDQAKASHRRILARLFPKRRRWNRRAPMVAQEQNLARLRPIFVAHDQPEFQRGQQHLDLASLRAYENQLIAGALDEIFVVDAFCAPCHRGVPLLAGTREGGPRTRSTWHPNWRETLTCPSCGMNNRQRLIATLLRQHLEHQNGATVYFMEQISPMYQWAASALSMHRIVGSEYLDDAHYSGQIKNGIRHEDAAHLSFADETVDLIVSNDVFEHVPDPVRAFAECARVLRDGGALLATIPFYSASDATVSRARKAASGQVEHLLPAQYHGNPMSSKGSLVFTDFGWDILAMLRSAGFADSRVAVYGSAHLGNLGNDQIVFEATKTRGAAASTPS